VLGPKGLMPNVKSGTLVKADDLVEAVKSSKQGLIEFRVNEGATIMNKFGKREFSDENLAINLDALLRSIANKRPDSVKGRYL
jgi:large subunit ribosomal protein L1